MVDSDDNGEGQKHAAEKAAEEQFSALVNHVLKTVQVTGRAYESNDLSENSDISSGEKLVTEEDKGNNFVSNGLFHKDGVSERVYDLQECLAREMHRIKGGSGGVNEAIEF